jgi:hypothetical protein
MMKVKKIRERCARARRSSSDQHICILTFRRMKIQGLADSADMP